MLKTNQSQPHVKKMTGNRVSSAVWPASIRRVVATGRTAQRRRDWLMQRRWLVQLVDALSVQVIFLLTTAMVMLSSLLVALLGLSFWYLLLAPLLLYAALTLLPAALVSKAPVETPLPTLSAFAQEFKSFSGLPAFPASELPVPPGSASGYAQITQDFPSLPLDREAPATPMPTEQPLVRVLETYDLRETRVRHFFEEMLRSEAGECMTLPEQPASSEFWDYTACPSTQNSHSSPRPDQLIPPSQVEEGQMKPGEH